MNTVTTQDLTRFEKLKNDLIKHEVSFLPIMIDEVHPDYDEDLDFIPFESVEIYNKNNEIIATITDGELSEHQDMDSSLLGCLETLKDIITIANGDETFGEGGDPEYYREQIEESQLLDI